MEDKLASIKGFLEKYNQEHILRWYDELKEEEKDEEKKEKK